jgi:hypothetical protein
MATMRRAVAVVALLACASALPSRHQLKMLSAALSQTEQAIDDEIHLERMNVNMHIRQQAEARPRWRGTAQAPDQDNFMNVMTSRKAKAARDKLYEGVDIVDKYVAFSKAVIGHASKLSTSGPAFREGAVVIEVPEESQTETCVGRKDGKCKDEDAIVGSTKCVANDIIPYEESKASCKGELIQEIEELQGEGLPGCFYYRDQCESLNSHQKNFNKKGTTTTAYGFNYNEKDVPMTFGTKDGGRDMSVGLVFQIESGGEPPKPPPKRFVFQKFESAGTNDFVSKVHHGWNYVQTRECWRWWKNECVANLKKPIPCPKQGMGGNGRKEKYKGVFGAKKEGMDDPIRAFMCDDPNTWLDIAEFRTEWKNSDDPDLNALFESHKDYCINYRSGCEVFVSAVEQKLYGLNFFEATAEMD